MTAIAHVELLCNSVTALVTPELYDYGLAAIKKIKSGDQMAKIYRNVKFWPSVYTAMQVIVNRTTPPHRDNGGCPTHYDLLVSSGMHQGTKFEVEELGVSLSYSPGTMVSLCGKGFFHQVHQWKGDRVCIAHFIKDTVHDRLDFQRPGWPTLSLYHC